MILEEARSPSMNPALILFDSIPANQEPKQNLPDAQTSSDRGGIREAGEEKQDQVQPPPRISETNGSSSAKKKRKKNMTQRICVSRACSKCRAARKKCSDKRPCERCASLGIPCSDSDEHQSGIVQMNGKPLVAGAIISQWDSGLNGYAELAGRRETNGGEDGLSEAQKDWLEHICREINRLKMENEELRSRNAEIERQKEMGRSTRSGILEKLNEIRSIRAGSELVEIQCFADSPIRLRQLPVATLSSSSSSSSSFSSPSCSPYTSCSPPITSKIFADFFKRPTGIGIFLALSQNSQILDANEKYFEMLGMSKQEIAENKWLRNVHASVLQDFLVRGSSLPPSHQSTPSTNLKPLFFFSLKKSRNCKARYFARIKAILIIFSLIISTESSGNTLWRSHLFETNTAMPNSPSDTYTTSAFASQNNKLYYICPCIYLFNKLWALQPPPPPPPPPSFTSTFTFLSIEFLFIWISKLILPFSLARSSLSEKDPLIAPLSSRGLSLISAQPT